jgi:hypothetical protein
MPLRRIFQTWWPLAASWLLMGAEGPAIAAVVARLANPVINLAAYGGIVSPLALIIESPIIMLLAASTALSKDWASYLKIRRFMMAASAALTVMHLVFILTPAYHFVVVNILGVPQAIVAPARVGLLIMLPWTWSIAYRRFHQGVLIRFGHTRTVSIGTAIRLSADGIVLIACYLAGTIPGIVVATTATIAGVVSEAIYVGLVVKPVLRNELLVASPVKDPLTLPSFLAFYAPLVMTSLLSLLAQPIGSAGLSRMPEALASLAVWPVVTGLIFMTRSLGIAYNEVVVALLDEHGSTHNLQRFAFYLSSLGSAILLLFAATQLSRFWFEQVSALSPHLVDLARNALWIAIPLPALSVFQSWFQGTILHGRRTRGITEAVVIYLVTSILVLYAGVTWRKMIGLYVGIFSLTASTIVQTGWLWVRSRTVWDSVLKRDAKEQIAEVGKDFGSLAG